MVVASEERNKSSFFVVDETDLQPEKIAKKM